MDISDSLSQFFDRLLGDTPCESPSSRKNKTRETTSLHPQQKRDSSNDINDTVKHNIEKPACDLDTHEYKKRKKRTFTSYAEDKSETFSNKAESGKYSISDVDKISVSHKLSNKSPGKRNVKLDDSCQEEKAGVDKKPSTIFSCSSDSGVKFTDDGFKIVSSIPADDSDISDVFESDSGDENVDEILDSEHEKGDGSAHKIVTEFSSDDSDASGAFESSSDVDMKEDISLNALRSVTEAALSVTDTANFRGEKCKYDKLDSSETVDVNEDTTKALKKPILKIMDDFGISSADLHKLLNQEGPKDHSSEMDSSKINTMASKLKPEVRVNVFDYSIIKRKDKGKPKKEMKQEREPTGKVAEKNEEKKMSKMELKKAKYEVLKFGVTGLKSKEKFDAKVALAIQLGAKPPKNKAINYRKLQDIRKKEKQEQKEEAELQKKMGLKVRSVKKERVKPKKGINIDFQSGKFKHGVQFLSKKEVQKVKKSK